jgi:hypothetical protein
MEFFGLKSIYFNTMKLSEARPDLKRHTYLKYKNF